MKQAPRARSGRRDTRWQVVGQLSAHHALVLKVELSRTEDAGRIARYLVEPLKERYVEALVYFYDAEPPRRLRGRIQWTTQGGYSDFEPLD